MHASGFRIGTAVVYDFGIHFFIRLLFVANKKRNTGKETD